MLVADPAACDNRPGQFLGILRKGLPIVDGICVNFKGVLAKALLPAGHVAPDWIPTSLGRSGTVP